MVTRFDRLAKWLKLPQILSVLNTVLLLHNALLLSRSLADTLVELTTQVLTVFGVKDESGNFIDVHEVLGNSINNFIVSLIGQEAWTGTKEVWIRGSRIVTSATQVVWSIRSIGDSLHELSEWTLENVGKIGNSLKRDRVVKPTSYPTMIEKVGPLDPRRKAIYDYMEGIESLEDAASSLFTVTGEIINIQEEANYTIDLVQGFDDQVDEFKEATDALAATQAEASKSPPIEPGDLEPGDSQNATP
jgi:hypothetical protein